jgi:hypothetical protein
MPELSEKSTHDDGVDLLTSTNDSGARLCIQSKYKIRGKDELDSIISKFQNYEARRDGNRKQVLFDLDEESPTIVFQVTTTSKAEGILKAYRASKLASKEFFERLEDESRISLVDGPKILSIVQGLGGRNHQ